MENKSIYLRTAVIHYGLKFIHLLKLSVHLY